MVIVPLSDEDREKLRGYWMAMFPKEYVNALFEDLPVPHYYCDYMVNMVEIQKRFELMDL